MANKYGGNSSLTIPAKGLPASRVALITNNEGRKGRPVGANPTFGVAFIREGTPHGREVFRKPDTE